MGDRIVQLIDIPPAAGCGPCTAVLTATGRIFYRVAGADAEWEEISSYPPGCDPNTQTTDEIAAAVAAERARLMGMLDARQREIVAALEAMPVATPPAAPAPTPKQRAALDELTRTAQEMGFYDTPAPEVSSDDDEIEAMADAAYARATARFSPAPAADASVVPAVVREAVNDHAYHLEWLADSHSGKGLHAAAQKCRERAEVMRVWLTAPTRAALRVPTAVIDAVKRAVNDVIRATESAARRGEFGRCAELVREREELRAWLRATDAGEGGGMNENMDALAQMVGVTFREVRGLERESTLVTFVAEDGRKWSFFHVRDCCESVALVDFEGTAEAMVGTPIVRAEETTSAATEVSESGTWTFYNISTARGSLWMRWLGESNGYYSEDVTVQITAPTGATGGADA